MRIERMLVELSQLERRPSQRMLGSGKHIKKAVRSSGATLNRTAFAPTTKGTLASGITASSGPRS